MGSFLFHVLRDLPLTLPYPHTENIRGLGMEFKHLVSVLFHRAGYIVHSLAGSKVYFSRLATLHSLD